MKSHKGAQLESLTISCGLHQLIPDPTHLLPNSSFCIDLIFTDQANLVVDSGAHPSLYPNCHHLDYGDILYHQTYYESINSKLESIQYNATLVITGTIKGTSRSKLYKELGLESLKSRRTLRRLCAFHIIVSTHLPTYLFNLIPQSTHAYQIRTSGNIPTYQCRTDTFKHSFFPWTVVQWNKIHPDIRNASIAVLKSTY